jgi:hypothetical protein
MLNWLLEHCINCNQTVTQTPVREDNEGDDILVREAVKTYREAQAGENPAKCDCGHALIARYALDKQNGVRIRA